jgi:hypothetical protein
VIFDGAISEQQIGGLSSSTFYDLDISNSFHVLRQTDFTIQDSLRLINGFLKLNLGMVTLLNPHPSAITRINGFIQAEADLLSANVYPFGRLNWKMGNSPGLHVVPFINAVGVYIPLKYEVVSGMHDVILGTYATYPNNLNLPLPEVTNVYVYVNGSIDSSGNTVVDRFYLVNNLMGVNPFANLTFAYSNAESSALGNPIMRAQRWLNANNVWENPFLPNQSSTSGIFNSVYVAVSDSIFATSEWWSISTLTTPLGTGLLNAENETAKVYPNPTYAGSELKLVLNDPTFNPEFIQLLSLEGCEIFHEAFRYGKSSIQIPENLSPGIYILMLKSDRKSGMIKLIVFDR